MSRLARIFAWIGRIGVVLLVWLAIILLFQFIVMPLYTRQGREVEVPDVRGRLLSDARAVYGPRGFRLVVDDERFDAALPPGTVVDQFPPPGGATKRGRRIHVAVSVGPPFAVVPDLRGEKKEEALFALQRSGLTADSILYDFSDSLYEGLVLRQRPEPGDTISPGDTVRVVVSLGPRPARVVVPDLLGLPEEQAKYLALKAGLAVAPVEYDRYVKEKNGVVVYQRPPQHTETAFGDSVHLVVNRK